MISCSVFPFLVLIPVHTKPKLHMLLWNLCLHLVPLNHKFINVIIPKVSVQFSGSVVYNSLQPHWLQHARPPCPSPTPGVYSNSCPLNHWCQVPFSCLQSFPASGSFPVSLFFASGDQSTGSFSSSISPSSEYSGLISFRMDYLDLLAVQGTLKSLLQHDSSKASILLCSAFFMVQHSKPYMTTWKAIALTRQTFVGKVISLLSNMLSRLVIAFIPKSKCLLIFMAVVTIHSDFGAQENKIWHYLQICLPWSDGTRRHDLHFLNVEF